MTSLSIIIPTRDRRRYCEATIRSVLAFDEDFELVVQDTSDEAGLEAFCASCSDARLRYVRAVGGQGMTADFERALTGFSGAYACMIGDDDGVTPALFEAAREAARRGFDSVVSTKFSVLYNWPDFSSKYGGTAAAGRLVIGALDGAFSFRPAQLAPGVEAFLAGAGQGCGRLPRAYHGLVSRALVERMRGRFGSCFAGVSPDVSFAFQAALASERHAEVSWPMTISGASGGSNAGRSARREHVGDLWSDPHMKPFRGVLVWPDVIPEFFSVETVWGQAAWEAVQRAGPEYERRFALPTLYAMCLIRHPDRARLTAAAVARYAARRRLSPAGVWAEVAAALARAGAREGVRVGTAAARRLVPARGNTVRAASDVAEASSLLRSHFERRRAEAG